MPITVLSSATGGGSLRSSKLLNYVLPASSGVTTIFSNTGKSGKLNQINLASLTAGATSFTLSIAIDGVTLFTVNTTTPTGSYFYLNSFGVINYPNTSSGDYVVTYLNLAWKNSVTITASVGSTSALTVNLSYEVDA